MTPYWLEADWPAPVSVRAVTTLRQGGVSAPPFDSWNLAMHVEDDRQHVQQNRELLVSRLKLPAQPCWLEQVHGIHMLNLDHVQTADLQADGSYSRSQGRICAVLTADCLPVLLCNRDGSEVAAVHAGWRGLAGGVLESAIRCFSARPSDLLVWLGPAIGPQAFEVGVEVLRVFTRDDAGAVEAFTDCGHDKYLADIYRLARRRLHRAGVDAVYGGGLCTVNDAARFFSFRRDRVCGRMASLVWIDG